MQKVALITGITGQDASYLAEFLLGKGYVVWGLKRKTSLFNTDRIDHLIKDTHEVGSSKLNFLYGDMSDSSSITKIIQRVQPDEIYNLAAMSHVRVSFDIPEYTIDIDGIGMLRILEAVRLLGLAAKIKIYNASTSELYGKIQAAVQDEKTPFYPRSPYAVAKLYSHWITVNYREAYNMFACNGILFNHESPIRGETFVSRKTTRAMARISLGLQKKLYLGNLNAKRDWGYAPDYVEAMYLMLQQDKPDDYVIATGVAVEVRELVRLIFAEVGIVLDFIGNDSQEKGIIANIDSDAFESKVNRKPNDLKSGQVLVEIDPGYYRPTEVDLLLGDATKARTKLGWVPKHDLGFVVEEMVKYDLELAKREACLKDSGFVVIPKAEER